MTREKLHKRGDERRRDGTMLHALAAAPLDDEPSDLDEDAGAVTALAAYWQGEAVSSEQLRAELDLD